MTLARLVLCMSLALAIPPLGCGGGGSLVATRHVANAPGVAHVVLREIDGNILELVVYNEGADTMILDRDAIFLVTKSGTHPRVPGGIARAYNIPPYGMHDVKVKFDLGVVERGETAQVSFARALSVRGQPVPIEPILLQGR